MKINHIITEFVTPQAAAQDPALEREPNVDIIFFGEMPRDFTADTVAEALEAVLPREYPPGSSDTANSNVYRVVTEIAKHQGAVVTNKPLSVAQKLVKTFQTYGIKCKIDGPGLDEAITRRGFLQGAGAAAVAGAANAQNKKFTPEQIETIRTGLAGYIRLKDTGSEDYPFPKRLKTALDKISKMPGGKEIIQSQYGQLRKQYYGLSEDEKSTWIFYAAPKIVHDLEAMVEFNESVEQGVAEGFVDTVKDKYAQFKDYFDDSPEAVERKLARLRATNAEAQPGANAAAVTAQSAEDPYMILGIEHGADSNAIKLAYRRLAKKHHPDAGGSAAEFQKIKDAFNQLLSSGAVVREGTAGLPDPNNFDSDNDYYDAMDAYGKPQDTDSDYENMDDAESDDWFDESKEKVGNMDADAFDAALSRMKKLAGAGPLRTVYDPARRVYKNVPHAVQPAQQPKKAR